MMSTKRALVILTPGAEEIETITTVDVLRRGGVEVTLAGLLGPDAVQCRCLSVVKPDTSLDDALTRCPYDAIVLPGGLKASETLSESPKVGSALKAHESSGRLVAAICAAPIALAAHGIGRGKKITSHYSLKDRFAGYHYLEDRVVQDGNLITSRGPGTAMEFALKLVEHLQGKEKAEGLTATTHFNKMAERRGYLAQDVQRVKGAYFVKPIVYGNLAKAFGRKREEDNHTHSWTLYVRPYYNEDMSQYVRKVVFKLHESYANSTRVITEPPYEVRESGWGEFEATIKIHFMDPAERHVNIVHLIKLFNTDPLIMAGKKSLVSEFYDEVVFQEPTVTMYNILKSSPSLTIGRHDTDFENKRERTLKLMNSARDEVRAEVTDLKECLQEAKKLIQKFKDDINKAEKESAGSSSTFRSAASTSPSASVQSDTNSKG